MPRQAAAGRGCEVSEAITVLGMCALLWLFLTALQVGVAALWARLTRRG